ncbi:hypothetical protein BRADI_3g28992v3 [Brachypodium distachyon]|uniref:Uncharacterized protein n=1 Tax=Brachypodium distachyon TaxID=15368 RepID=A0A2K2CZW1_BRADI|nr:hypothetical protein BRADI_3g28992v3 [Brachypodium distachyon]
MIDQGVGVPSDVKTFAQRQFQLRKKKQGDIRRIVAMLQEIKEGRTVSRSELYCVVHTNKKGEPVDAYFAGKMGP